MSTKSKVKKQPIIIEEDDDIKVPLDEWGLRGSQLYLHQRNNVTRMEFNERNQEREYNRETRTTKITSNFGILNDVVGSGKTLTTVSLLSRDSLIPTSSDHKETRTLELGSNGHFTYTVEEETTFNVIPINVVVVSASIYNQWERDLNKTDLRYYKIIKNIDIRNLDKETIERLDVILVTYNRYKDFTDKFNIIYHTSRVGIKRLIFDELQLRGNVPMAKAKFYWLLSATLPNEDDCLNYKITYNNAINKLLYCVKQKYVSIKNTPEELTMSYQQAKVINIRYICYNKTFNIFGNRLTNEIQRMIAADDIAGAITALGGTSETGSLLDIIISREEKEINKIKASIAYHQSANNDNREEKIEEYKAKLEVAIRSLENLKEKIQRDTGDENSCPLCFEECKEQVLTLCCKSVMCSLCVKNLYKTTQKCPYCRKKLEMKDMVISSKEVKEKTEKEVTEQLTKIEMIKKIISQNKDGRFILFSEFSFLSIKEDLKNENISFAEVKGTSDMKQKYIKMFKEGKIKVLFLNSRNDGSGIDLPEATDVILYHKMSCPQIETQVLGRALRLGRTSNLKVHRLLYCEEENISDNAGGIIQLHRSQINDQDERRMREQQEEEDRQLALRLQNEI